MEDEDDPSAGCKEKQGARGGQINGIPRQRAMGQPAAQVCYNCRPATCPNGRRATAAAAQCDCGGWSLQAHCPMCLVGWT